jgi:hypothetical protein
VPDDQSAQDAALLLQAIRDLHNQQHPNTPLAPGTPVAPDIAAEQSQPEINPALNSRRYEAALSWLVWEEALAPHPAAWKVTETVYFITWRGEELLRGIRLPAPLCAK